MPSIETSPPIRSRRTILSDELEAGWDGCSQTFVMARRSGADSDASRTTPRPCAKLALTAIDATAFFPKSGQTRMRGMVESRPDWLISPPARLGHAAGHVRGPKRTGEPLQDAAVNARIVGPPSKSTAPTPGTPADRPQFLGPKGAIPSRLRDRCRTSWTSGSTAARPTPSPWRGANDTRWPADLYLEGTDQARGWFQSSLLESLRHAGAGALRRGADPRLHHGRERREDVQVQGQHGRSAEGDRRQRRGDPAPVGGHGRLCRGPAHRQGHPADRHRRLPQAAQHPALSARRPGGLHWGGGGGPRRHAAAGTLRAAPAVGAGRPGARRLRRVPLQRRLAAGVGVRRPGAVGALLRHPQGRALLRRAVQPAPPRLPHGDGRGVRCG